MAIQIEQRFPRCARCGKIMPFQEVQGRGVKRPIVYCSSRCREEHQELVDQQAALAREST